MNRAKITDTVQIHPTESSKADKNSLTFFPKRRNELSGSFSTCITNKYEHSSVVIIKIGVEGRVLEFRMTETEVYKF